MTYQLYPSLTAGDLIVNLKKQIDPFKPTLLMNQKVDELKKCNEFYNVKTSENNIIVKMYNNCCWKWSIWA